MGNLTLNELRLIAGRRGIKNYRNMSREKLLSTLDKSESNFQNILQNRLERIVKMQNLSQNDLEQNTRMYNQLRDELEQIAKMRRINNYKNMSKEELLITLLKSERSLDEFFKSKSDNFDNAKTKRIRKNFNKLRNRFSKSEIKKIN